MRTSPNSTPPPSGDQDRTLALIAKIRAGDERARDQLFRLYVDRVRRVVRLRLGSRLRRRLEVNDIVQSVLLHAVRDFDQFEYRGEGAFFHWLNRIVENRLRDRLKHEMRAKRDIRRDQTITEGLGTTRGVDPTAQLPTPSRIVSGREELDRIEAAIVALPHDLKEVLILRKYENLPWKDIATEIGLSEGAVRRLFARAVSTLARTVKGEDPA
ncbi:MAG: sigma-70 family RNA polymerase sigma factor [Planctomycetota bacterium]